GDAARGTALAGTVRRIRLWRFNWLTREQPWSSNTRPNRLSHNYTHGRETRISVHFHRLLRTRQGISDKFGQSNYVILRASCVRYWQLIADNLQQSRLELGLRPEDSNRVPATDSSPLVGSL